MVPTTALIGVLSNNKRLLILPISVSLFELALLSEVRVICAGIDTRNLALHIKGMVELKGVGVLSETLNNGGANESNNAASQSTWNNRMCYDALELGNDAIDCSHLRLVSLPFC